jgi:hypothetical protein
MMDTRTRQLDASLGAATRRRRRARLREARTTAATSNGPDAGAALATPSGAGRDDAAQIPGPRPARPSRVAALGARLARASRLVPPVSTPIASCTPTHATSGGS